MTTDPVAFVSALVADVLNADPDARAALLEPALRAKYAAAFAMGRREARALSAPDRERYLCAFVPHWTAKVAAAFLDIGPVALTTASADKPTAHRVSATAARSPGDPSRRQAVTYRLKSDADGTYLRLTDMHVDGVSVLGTEKELIQSMLRSDGFEAVLAFLESGSRHERGAHVAKSE
ncbi:ABC transporter substrate-binding protein [Streptomyces sp. NPDC006512]|uniref:ABC transporter substrate-binding protein n=1 Tax=Streptomyces sp. NPDC006512 TaxID=3154307 RepID=UPI0033A0B281